MSLSDLPAEPILAPRLTKPPKFTLHEISRSSTIAGRTPHRSFVPNREEVTHLDGNQRRWLFFLLKAFLLALVLVFLYRAIHKSLVGLREHDFDWRQVRWPWLVLSTAVYILGLTAMFFYWRRILTALGQPSSFLNALYAYSAGHLGKYVPGKAMVVMLRVGLLRDRQVAAAPLAASVLVETLTMMSVGALISAFWLSVNSQERPWMFLAAIVFLGIAGLPTLPPIFRRLVLRLARSPAEQSQLAAALPRLNYRLLVEGWLLNLAGWTCLGISLWGVVVAISSPAAAPPLVSLLPSWVAWVSLPVVAGFLSFLPGGVLVREGLLISVLEQSFSPVTAVVGALLLRVTWLAGELLLASVLHVAARWQHSATVPSPPSPPTSTLEKSA